MKILFYDTKIYDKESFNSAEDPNHIVDQKQESPVPECPGKQQQFSGHIRAHSLHPKSLARAEPFFFFGSFPEYKRASTFPSSSVSPESRSSLLT